MTDEVNSQITDSVTQTNENSAGAQDQLEKEQPKNVLFGSIGYNDDPSYENFLKNMNLGQALFVLIASTNFAQAKGSFNILESETLSTAIRIIRKNSSSAEPPSQNNENISQ